jgi:hypothetical protein
MSGKKSQLTQEIEKFAQALWLEIPNAFVRRALGQADESTITEAGWKAYDAWIGMANEVTNRIYENDTVAEVTGRAMEAALRVQQVSRTLANAFFNNWWPAVGLPTTNDVALLRAELAALQEQLQAAAGQKPEQTPAVYRAIDDGLKLVRGNGHVKRSGESKEDAAA